MIFKLPTTFTAKVSRFLCLVSLGLTSTVLASGHPALAQSTLTPIYSDLSFLDFLKVPFMILLSGSSVAAFALMVCGAVLSLRGQKERFYTAMSLVLSGWNLLVLLPAHVIGIGIESTYLLGIVIGINGGIFLLTLLFALI